MSLFGGIGGSALGRVLVEVGLDSRPLEAGMVKAKGTATKGATGIGSSFSTAIKAGAILAGAAVIKFGADSVKAFAQSQQMAAQTAAVLKSTGGAANVTADDVSNLANSLRDLTGIDDEAIQGAENMILTFTNIRNEAGKGNDIFNQTTTAVLDMATAMNQGAIPSAEQLKQTSIQLGKAINDPISGLTALKRVGVSFDASQVAVIQHLQDTGQLLKAQKLVLAEVKTEFGGAAKAAGSTFAGSLAKLSSHFGDIQEAVGKALMPVLTDLVSILEKLMPLISFAAGHWKELLVAFLAFKATGFLTSQLKGLSFALNGLGTATTAAGRAAQGAAGFMQSYGNLIPIVGVAVLGFTQLVAEMNKQIGAKTAAALAAGGAALDAWTSQLDNADGKLHGFLGGLLSAFAPGMKLIQSGLDDQKKALEDATAAMDAAQKQAADGAPYAAFQKGIGATLPPLKEYGTDASRAAFAAEHLAAAQKKATDAAKAQYVAELALAGGLLGIEGSAIQAAQAHDSLKAAQAKVNQLTNAGKQGTTAYKQALADERQAVLDATTSQLGLVQSVQDYIKSNGSSKASTAEAIGLIRQYGRENGLTAGEVNHLIGEVTGLVTQYGKVPNSVMTQVLANGLAGNLSDLARYNNYLAGLNGKQVYITVHTNYVNTGSAPHGGIQ